jgi:hypothetical protein
MATAPAAPIMLSRAAQSMSSLRSRLRSRGWVAALGGRVVGVGMVRTVVVGGGPVEAGDDVLVVEPRRRPEEVGVDSLRRRPEVVAVPERERRLLVT